MKYVKLLPPITLIDRTTKKPWKGQDGRAREPIVMTNQTFLVGRLCDLLFGSGSENIRSSMKIEKAIEEAVVYVQLEDTDHSKLVQTIASPSPQTPFISEIAPSIYPFMEAVEQAPSELPEEWKKEREEALEEKEAAAGEQSKSEPETEPAS